MTPGKTVTMNVKIKDYTSRVLGVVKEKYGLRDKGEALDKFAEMCGSDFVELEAKESYLKKLDEIEKNHLKKYGGYRHISVDEFRKQTRRQSSK